MEDTTERMCKKLEQSIKYTEKSIKDGNKELVKIQDITNESRKIKRQMMDTLIKTEKVLKATFWISLTAAIIIWVGVLSRFL